MNDYVYNLINKFVSVVCGLTVSVILARYLGVHLRGELAFVMQVGGLLAIVVGMGVNQAFIFQFRKDPTSEGFAKVVSILLAQIGLFAVIAVPVGLMIDDRSAVLILMLAGATAAYQQFESIMAAYNIRLKIRVNLANSLVRVGAHIVMWWTSSANLEVPVAIAVVTALLSVAAYIFLAQGQRFERPSYRLALEFYRFGWVPMLTSLLVVLNYSVDLVMLKVLGSGTDLGLYAVAAGVVTYLWVVPDAIKEVLVSRVVRTRDPRAVLLPLKAAVLAGLVSVVACALLGLPLVPALFGEEFAGAYPLIVVLSAGVISMIYFKVLGVIVLAEGHRWFYFGALLVAVSLNAVGNAIVIPLSGALGAAWVCVGSYTATGAAFVFYFSRMSRCSVSEIVVIRKRDLVSLKSGWGGTP